LTRAASRWLVAGTAVLLLAGGYVFRIRDGMADFAVNHRAGQRLAAGETLYQPADGHYMFKYLPASALLYLPLSSLPLEAAKPVWFAISIAAMFWLFWLARQITPGRDMLWVSILPPLILAKYFLHELRLGQINILVTVVLMLALRALQQVPDTRQEIAAGALVGLATALKPYAALFFPYLLLKRSWTSVVAGLGVLFAALAVPALFYGVERNVWVLGEWARTLSQSTPDLLANNDNVSVIAFFTKWTGDAATALRWTGIVLASFAVLMVAIVAKGAGRGATVLEWAMVLCLIPLVSPLGWDYTFLAALPAITLLVRYFGSFPAPARIALAVNLLVVALALYDVMGREAYRTFMQWSVTTVNFIVIVGALAFLRFRGQC
jgi:hypothetical protein